jgi:predicted ATP-dependent serine protease
MQLNTLETKFAKCSSIEIPDVFYNRMITGCSEIDQMFGTEHLPGFMPGSAITITGTPGAGKSTKIAQICQMLCDQGKRTAIASGEESHIQLAYTCKRLNVTDVDVAHIKDVEEIAAAMHHYDFMVVDSFQALRSNKNMKKREFYQYAQDLLLSTAKETGCVIVFVLHITTQGLPKGGTDIIHAVDVNMKVTVDKNDESMRIIHVYKNRFGETKMHMAMMTSRGFDFKGTFIPSDDEKINKKPASEERKKNILEMKESPHLTLDRICDSLGVSGQTASVLLRELVGEGRLQKFGRGTNAIWKIVQDCKELHKALTE